MVISQALEMVSPDPPINANAPRRAASHMRSENFFI